jgi:hypothetical protein
MRIALYARVNTLPSAARLSPTSSRCGGGDGSKSFDIGRQLPGNSPSCNHRLAAPSDETFLSGIDKVLELVMSYMAEHTATVTNKWRSQR